MAVLKYDIEVTGSEQIGKALREIEEAFAEHKRRVAAIIEDDADPVVIAIRKSGVIEIRSGDGTNCVVVPSRPIKIGPAGTKVTVR